MKVRMTLMQFAYKWEWHWCPLPL